jgi:hypothetical protein
MVGGAYEPFDYPVGTAITQANSLNGGGGWNTAGNPNGANDADARWGDAIALPAAAGNNRTVQAPSLTFTATGYPASLGNKAVIDANTANATNNVSRNFKQLVDSGNLWFSYLTDRNNDTHRTTSLTFFGPANGVTGQPGNVPERFSIGQLGTGTAGTVNSMGNFALQMNNTNPANVVQSATPVNYGTNITHLVVGRVQFDNGAANVQGFNDTVTVWIDPTDVTSIAALGTPNLQSNGFELTSFNSIRLFSGNQAAAADGAPIKVAVSTDFDEIRIGSTLLEAVTTVPEPGSLALAGIAAVFYGCCGCRRFAQAGSSGRR